jgi:hypothetical protein
MKKKLQAVLLGGLILLGGCVMGPSTFLGDRDREISAATEALESASDDAQRAEAYSNRGAAYSEKARYSRISKLIPNDEYERLFDLAVNDHDQAVTLDPESAKAYFNRAQAYYDRGALDLLDEKNGKPWFDYAAVDFTKATEKNPKDDLAFDRLGLTHESNDESEKAIVDYTHEMALNPNLGSRRLADAYCDRGSRLQQKNPAAAAEAYQKSIEFGTASDKTCRDEPYAALIAIYTNRTHEYDKAWDMVHQAQALGRRIQEGMLERLKKNSGRAD